MLSHYSAFKVAENFRLLETLYPGRIDLGIGRAPGSDQLTAAALSYPGRPRDISYFPEQITDLLGYLGDDLEPQHPFAARACRTGQGDHAGSVAARLAHGIGLSGCHAGAAI